MVGSSNNIIVIVFISNVPTRMHWQVTQVQRIVEGIIDKVVIERLKSCNTTKTNLVGIEFWVVYRSWIFGFDSGIPRVTISGRFCDWTGSRGLHLLVSEPSYAIIGTVSKAPIAYTTIENVVLVKQLEQLDPCSC
ncbi:hypothetical protein GQ457_11G024550 [Hibiscus cannabinus]